ncbi:MAG: hypothetical protein IPP81_19110 [Chitinophagaceae bacterium]|nr:hypothetical protein [Chitinophagaceae bacterium]
MKRTAFLIIIILSIFSFTNSCKKKATSYSETNPSLSSKNIVLDDEDGYSDGDYCAVINYYYSKTGTNSTYTLKVEIEDNELVKIYWPNGGWLDNSHFNPPDISDGSASFVSYNGVEYTVTIKGKDIDCSYSYSAKDEDELIQESKDEICPKCGRNKYSWKKICNRCIDENENTCSKCGGYEYNVNGGLCQNCKEEIIEESKQDEDQTEN